MAKNSLHHAQKSSSEPRWSTVLGQEMHILMDHQTLTKMCNYLRCPHYAVPPSWWHCFTVSHTSSFSEFLRVFIVLVAWGQCLKAGTVMSKNTEWGTRVLGVRVNMKLSGYVNFFEKKKQFLQRLFFVALSDIKLLFFLSFGRASTGMLYLSERQKCSSKWENLEEYRITISRGLLEQIIHLFIRSASFMIWLTWEKTTEQIISSMTISYNF